MKYIDRASSYVFAVRLYLFYTYKYIFYIVVQTIICNVACVHAIWWYADGTCVCVCVYVRELCVCRRFGGELSTREGLTIIPTFLRGTDFMYKYVVTCKYLLFLLYNVGRKFCRISRMARKCNVSLGFEVSMWLTAS